MTNILPVVDNRRSMLKFVPFLNKTLKNAFYHINRQPGKTVAKLNDIEQTTLA